MDEAKKYLEEERARLVGKLEEAKKMASEVGMEEMAKEEIKRIETEIENVNKAIGGPPSHEATEGQARSSPQGAKCGACLPTKLLHWTFENLRKFSKVP